jgi:inward rectifier potassium channel
LSLRRSEHPALALSWTLYHVVDENSPLYQQNAEDFDATSVTLTVVVSGYDVVAAQTVYARRSYDHADILFGRSYVDILGPQEDGRLRLDYGRFNETVEQA